MSIGGIVSGISWYCYSIYAKAVAARKLVKSIPGGLTTFEAKSVIPTKEVELDLSFTEKIHRWMDNFFSMRVFMALSQSSKLESTTQLSTITKPGSAAEHSLLNKPKSRKARAAKADIETILLRKSMIITGATMSVWSSYLVIILYEFITDLRLPSEYYYPFLLLSPTQQSTQFC